MDKRAQSYGISWFFATIVIFFILVLFVVASGLLGLNNKNAVIFDSFKEFNNVKNLNEFHVFYEYGENTTLGNLSYNIKSGSLNDGLNQYFLSYSDLFYNLSVDKKNNLKANCLVFYVDVNSIPFFVNPGNKIFFNENAIRVRTLQNPSKYYSLPASIYFKSEKNKFFPVEIMSEGC